MLRNYGISLTISEKLEFLNLWYVMICVNDSLIIGGSSMKVLLETKYTSEELCKKLEVSTLKNTVVIPETLFSGEYPLK